MPGFDEPRSAVVCVWWGGEMMVSHIWLRAKWRSAQRAPRGNCPANGHAKGENSFWHCWMLPRLCGRPAAWEPPAGGKLSPPAGGAAGGVPATAALTRKSWRWWREPPHPLYAHPHNSVYTKNRGCGGVSHHSHFVLIPITALTRRIVAVVA